MLPIRTHFSSLLRRSDLLSALRDDGVPGAAALLRYRRHMARVARGPGRECPVCGWTGTEFAPLLDTGYRILREYALCPDCGAKERHRAYPGFYRTMFRAEQPGRQADVVHFAPERCFEPLFRELAASYRTSTFPVPRPQDVPLDLEALALPDASVDVFVLNHVLCCVADDRGAVGELHRVLRPGGLVLAGENVGAGRATRDLAQRGYGGILHQYGEADLESRFAPFAVELVDVTEGRSDAELRRFGLKRPEHVIVLRRKVRREPAASGA